MPSADPRYPIGRFTPAEPYSPAERGASIAAIERLPDEMRQAVHGLTPGQLDTPYREGGWTVRQVVHHVPDSHLNAYMRFKLALTEDEPTIKPYEEALWAELPDSRTADPAISLALLDALHGRWTLVLRGMQEREFARRFRHPEHDALLSLDRVTAMYAWHGRHHLAHITGLRERQGWR